MKVWEWLGMDEATLFDKLNIDCDKCPVYQRCRETPTPEGEYCGLFLAKCYDEVENK